jgi:hypothetical protein
LAIKVRFGRKSQIGWQAKLDFEGKVRLGGNKSHLVVNLSFGKQKSDL